MIRLLDIKRFLLIPLIALPLSSMAHLVLAEEQTRPVVVSPIRLSDDMIGGIGLETTPWPDEARHAKWSFLFTGQELSVSVFESRSKKLGDSEKAGKAAISNYPYDQFVLVLSGKSVLTDAAGQSHSFSAGDYFVVPKGFSGTWAEYGVYRELIVVLEEAMRTRPLDMKLLD